MNDDELKLNASFQARMPIDYTGRYRYQIRVQIVILVYSFRLLCAWEKETSSECAYVFLLMNDDVELFFD